MKFMPVGDLDHYLHLRHVFVCTIAAKEPELNQVRGQHKLVLVWESMVGYMKTADWPMHCLH